TPEVPEWAGSLVFEANPHIVEHLRARGALLAAAPFKHSYPHCWRCKNPVVFRATEQWFIGIDRAELRARALAEIRRVRWTPEWGRERLGNMIATRPDWCLSRQKDWGVPVVAVYCEGCGQPCTSEALCAHAAAPRARRACRPLPRGQRSAPRVVPQLALDRRRRGESCALRRRGHPRLRARRGGPQDVEVARQRDRARGGDRAPRRGAPPALGG